VVGVHVRVDLRRGDRGVAEHLLYGAQVRCRLEQVRREGVAQRVRRHLGREAGEERGALDDAPARSHVERPPRRRGRRTRARAGPVRAAVRHPARQRFASPRAERHEPRLSALAVQRDHAQRGLERVRAQAHGLADACARCVEHLEQCALARRAGRGPCGTASSRSISERTARAAARGAGAGPRCSASGSRAEATLVDLVPQAHAQRGQRARHGARRGPRGRSSSRCASTCSALSARQRLAAAPGQGARQRCDVAAVGERACSPPARLDAQGLQEVRRPLARAPRRARASRASACGGTVPTLAMQRVRSRDQARHSERTSPSAPRFLEGPGVALYTPAPEARRRRTAPATASTHVQEAQRPRPGLLQGRS
jgi:hypothetical protein